MWKGGTEEEEGAIAVVMIEAMVLMTVDEEGAGPVANAEVASVPDMSRARMESNQSTSTSVTTADGGVDVAAVELPVTVAHPWIG